MKPEPRTATLRLGDLNGVTYVFFGHRQFNCGGHAGTGRHLLCASCTARSAAVIAVRRVSIGVCAAAGHRRGRVDASGRTHAAAWYCGVRILVLFSFFLAVVGLDHWFRYYHVDEEGALQVFGQRTRPATYVYVIVLFALAAFYSGQPIPFIYFEF